LTPAQHQKCLFLLGRAYPDRVQTEDWYRFRPHNYGAFDSAVYEDAERMYKDGLVDITRSQWGWKEYSATDLGLEKARELESELPANVRKYLAELVAWARSLSFEQLIRAVYETYPETKTTSVFEDAR